MTDIVEIGLKVDSSQVKDASRYLDNLSESSRNAEISTTALNSAYLKFAAAAAAAYAVVSSAYSVIMSSVQAYNEAAKSAARWNAVLNSTGWTVGYTANQIERLAQQIGDTSLFDDSEIQRATMALLLFQNVQRETFSSALRLSADVAAALGGDMQSAAMQLGKALESPADALSSLTRIGVIFNSEQRNQIESFVKANRLAEAQGVIIDALAGKFGGAAQKMRDADIGIHGFLQAIDDLKKVIGENFAEIFSGVADSATGFVRRLADSLRAPRDQVDLLLQRIYETRERIAGLGRIELAARARLKQEEADLINQYSAALTIYNERAIAEEREARAAAETAAQREREAKAAREQAQYEEQIRRARYAAMASEGLATTLPEMGPPVDYEAAYRGRIFLEKYEEQQQEKLAIQRQALNDEFNAAIAMEQKLNDEFERLAKERADRQNRINEQAHAQTISGYSSMLGSLAQLADGNNRKAFKMSQRLARAQAVVDAYAAGVAAAKSAASLGPGAAFAAYAAVVAGLMARLKAINSQSYDGGGGSAAVGGAGPGPVIGTNATTTPNSIPVSGQQQQQMNVQIFVNGALTPQQLTDQVIIPLLQDRINNQDVVLAPRDSRQAYEVRA